MIFVRKVSVLLLATFLSGCIVTTEVVERYDEDCQIHTRHVVLNSSQWGMLGECSDTRECTSKLLGAGLISATTAVVSGSVVIVGNAVYWLEKQGRCQRKADNKSEPEQRA